MKEAKVFEDTAGTRPGKRIFTLEQANRTLPLVSRIVADVVSLYEQTAGLHERLAAEPAASCERERIEAKIEDQEEAFDRLVNELDEVGCELKDARMGLVDFTGRHDGRDVCLCWRFGEDKIAFWHEFQAGFAGRQEVAGLHESPG